ncbi:MAG: hypothetical protein MAG551_01740 [Candidatus Scalindua arabica]|uniref:Uncharacterized protein n=1 Tax=Candidatus Scalindua arabica TaxID=1127984 RepID=A0A941W3P8_9BACT|nr:hypothetical protein [Candidatus Scalindua arabica]
MEMFSLLERYTLLHFLPYGEEKYFLYIGIKCNQQEAIAER